MQIITNESAFAVRLLLDLSTIELGDEFIIYLKGIRVLPYNGENRNKYVSISKLNVIFDWTSKKKLFIDGTTIKSDGFYVLRVLHVRPCALLQAAIVRPVQKKNSRRRTLAAFFFLLMEGRKFSLNNHQSRTALDCLDTTTIAVRTFSCFEPPEPAI